VLETLRYLVHETSCWTEITTLLIPGHNDSDAELGALAEWIARELGTEVPLHFSAFHPDYKLQDVAATPASTLARARRIAQGAGLRHVYTAISATRKADHLLPGLPAELIVRNWHRITAYDLDVAGNCPHCGQRLAGRFDAKRETSAARAGPAARAGKPTRAEARRRRPRVRIACAPRQ